MVCSNNTQYTFFLSIIQQELVKVREKLNRLEATARKTGPRIEVTHDEEQLAKLIKKNESKLK